MKSYDLIILICSMTVWLVNGQRSCYTPLNKNGVCIGVEDCQYVSSILHNKLRNRSDSTYLRDSACAFDNQKLKVCCEVQPKRDGNCTTPDQRIGLCINLFDCPSLSVSSSTQRKLIEQSACGGSAFNVCCGDDILFPPVSQKQVLPARTECGFQVRQSKLQDLQNGKTGIYAYPWQALLEYLSRKNNKMFHGCGAILISSQYLLSMAQCFSDKSRGYVVKNVILGEYDLRTDIDCEEDSTGRMCNDMILRVPVSNVISHPDYTSSEYLNDIALVKMSKSVQYTDYIKPICLPQMNIMEDEIDPTQQYMTSGWYLVYEDRTEHKPETKLHIKVPLLPQSECKSFYDKHNFEISDNQFCVGGVANISTCKGDSSLPLMRLRNGQFELLGLLSFGPSECGLENVPDIFTNVYPYIDWVIKNME